jgi:hypothetical protein
MGILDELTGRLELGLRKYNHGVRTDDDTRDWGTPVNSWLYMAREEFLDAMIYIAADYIRKSGLKRDEGEEDDNKLIMHVIGRYSRNGESQTQNASMATLQRMLNSIST